MSVILLDTHAWAWTLTRDERLTRKAVALIEKAESVFVSPISFFEIGQKVRLGKWPEMAPFVEELPKLLAEQGGRVATATPQICLSAAMLDWQHRDSFDRLLAATAISSGLPLLSADTVFDGLVAHEGWIARIW